MKINENVDRAIKYFLFPLLAIVLVIMVIIPEWRLSGFVALGILGFSWLIFTSQNPKIKKHLIGVAENPSKGSLWGIGLFSLFFIITRVIPALSIGIPEVPQSVGEFSFGGFAIGTQLSIFILVIIFPFAETFYHISVNAALRGIYGLSFFKANLIQGISFGSILHLLAYGVVLASASSFDVALNQISNISGLLFTASLFGFLAGFILNKIQNYVPVALAHAGINFGIVSVTLALISL